VKGLTSEVRSWLEQGAYARVDGVDVFYRVAGEACCVTCKSGHLIC